MSSEPRRAKVPAFAKLNLGLLVLYKRPDGFHELRTVFQTVSLKDSLDIELRRARRTFIELESSVDIPGNIVTRAASLVLERLGLNANVRIRLRKNIPMGGGLGGGSSDAAAVLLALPVLAEKALPEVELHRLAAGLGSDVPFFLTGGTALGLGRGEELYPMRSLPTAHGLIVVPSVAVSTPDAYKALSRGDVTGLTSQGVANKIERFQSFVRLMECPGPNGDWKAFCENDFEVSVFQQYPLLRSLGRKLRDSGAIPARMTGSGSALFGLFESAVQAARAASGFGRTSPEARVERFQLVSRERYRAAWRRALQPYARNEQWPPRNKNAR